MGTTEGHSRASRGGSKGAQACSTIDCIMHLRPLQQALRGGRPASSTPEWLSGVGRSVRTCLQHWLKPRHLKGEDFRLKALLCKAACRLAALGQLSRVDTLVLSWSQHWRGPGTWKATKI